MGRGKRRNLLLLWGSALLAAVGQLLFKYSFTSSFVAGWLALGVVAYGMSTVAYFYVLSRVHLSWAYGIGGLSYIFATVFAYFILIEDIPLLRWVGVIVITIGVILIGTS